MRHSGAGTGENLERARGQGARLDAPGPALNFRSLRIAAADDITQGSGSKLFELFSAFPSG